MVTTWSPIGLCDVQHIEKMGSTTGFSIWHIDDLVTDRVARCWTNKEDEGLQLNLLPGIVTISSPIDLHDVQHIERENEGLQLKRQSGMETISSSIRLRDVQHLGKRRSGAGFSTWHSDNLVTDRAARCSTYREKMKVYNWNFNLAWRQFRHPLDCTMFNI